MIFIEKTNTYNLRSDDGFMVPRANTTAHGIETIRYIGSRFLQSLPKEIKEFQNLQVLCEWCQSWVKYGHLMAEALHRKSSSSSGTKSLFNSLHLGH